MRNLALSVAAILVLAVASPAFAQPFADVPTDHWAFDAIAELAAKGIIEGFPDGTFKGDRGVSRYEVAIIVARILARIEAIKIPAPAPAAAPQVTRTDVQTIQRLVNEFRAELAALGVRTTAVEEELTALKQQTTNVRITGETRLRYKMFGAGATGVVPATTIEWRARLKFTGKAAPNVTAFAQLNLSGLSCTGPNPVPAPPPATFPVTCTTGTTTTFGTNVGALLVSEYTYLDANLFGVGWRLGQQDGTLGNGLLFGGDPTGGLKSTWSFAGFNLETAVYSAAGDFAGDFWAARGSTNLAGFGLGASYYSERPTGGTSSDGYGVDLSGTLLPGVSFLVDYASWTPSAGPSAQAYKAQFDTDLGMVMGSGLKLSVWYKNYGTTTAGLVPPKEAAAFAGTEIFENFRWNFNGWGVKLNTSLGPFSTDLRYETGNRTTQGDAVNVYFVGLTYPLASNTSLLLSYRKEDGAGAVAGALSSTAPQYRAQVEVKY